MDHRDGREGLESRVMRLEKRLMLHRRLGLLAACLAAGVFALGAAAPAPKVVEAERFVLRDAAGNERGVWRMAAEGPEFILGDHEGKAVVMMGVAKESRGLIIKNENGGLRALVNRKADQSPLISFEDGKGAERMVFSLNPKHGPAIQMRDSAGQERILLSTLTDPASSVLGFKDEKGQTRATIGVIERWPALIFLNENQQPVWVAPTSSK